MYMMGHSKPPSPSRDELLEEYKESLAFMRHDDQIAWTILGLSTTVAFGVWAYTFKDIPFRSRRSVILTLLGVLAFAFGRAMASRVTIRTNWRKKRASQIESELGFKLVRNRPSIPFGINRMLTWITRIMVGLWVAYFLVYVIYRWPV